MVFKGICYENVTAWLKSKVFLVCLRDTTNNTKWDALYPHIHRALLRRVSERFLCLSGSFCFFRRTPSTLSTDHSEKIAQPIKDFFSLPSNFPNIPIKMDMLNKESMGWSRMIFFADMTSQYNENQMTWEFEIGTCKNFDNINI